MRGCPQLLSVCRGSQHLGTRSASRGHSAPGSPHLGWGGARPASRGPLPRPRASAESRSAFGGAGPASLRDALGVLGASPLRAQIVGLGKAPRFECSWRRWKVGSRPAGRSERTSRETLPLRADQGGEWDRWRGSAGLGGSQEKGGSTGGFGCREGGGCPGGRRGRGLDSPDPSKL